RKFPPLPPGRMQCCDGTSHDGGAALVELIQAIPLPGVFQILEHEHGVLAIERSAVATRNPDAEPWRELAIEGDLAKVDWSLRRPKLDHDGGWNAPAFESAAIDRAYEAIRLAHARAVCPRDLSAEHRAKPIAGELVLGFRNGKHPWPPVRPKPF